MSTQPTPQPDSPQPDSPTAMVEGTQPESQPQAQPTPQPAPTSGGMFDKVLGVLAGKPKTYSVDPSTGKETSQPVTNRGTLAEHIVAAALVGLMKGATVHGPNAAGRAFGEGGAAGFNLGQQSDARAQQEPVQNYEREQQAATFKANAAEKNLRMLGLQQSLGDQDKNTHDAIVGTYADQLQTLKDESPNSILGEHVAEGEAKDPKKYSLTAQRIPDGVVPKVGPDGEQVKDANGIPQWEQTYTIVDANAKVPLSPDATWIKSANDWSIPGAKALAQGTGEVSVVAQNHFLHTIASLQTMESEVNGFRKQLGQPPIDLKSMVKDDPSLIPAVQQFQRTSLGSTQPDQQINAMLGDPKAKPYAGKIVSMFGGDNLQQFAENRTNKAAADKAAAEETARQNAQAASPQGQQQQKTKTLDEELKELQIQKTKQDLADKTVSEWKPKVSADEKKRAELGENIAYNANEVNGILAERPDLVGAVAGRYTNAKQMIGNNDPDISALGTEIHNIAIASVGIHGMRSGEQVDKAESQILNNFKNGPKAIGGALKSLTDSVQTFIDNARPEGYQTHSSKGGAAGYYQQQRPIPIFASAPGKPRAVSRDGGKTWQTVDQNAGPLPDEFGMVPVKLK